MGLWNDVFDTASAMERDADRLEQRAAWLRRRGKGDPEAASEAAALSREAADNRRRAARHRESR